MDFISFFAAGRGEKPGIGKFGLVTGFLIEFEDTLPFKGSLECVRADTGVQKCYTEEQIKILVKRVTVELGLKLIPLVQVFSHLEYVLKRSQYKELREEPEKMLSLCPLREGSLELVLELINQTLELLGRNNIEYFHLGADEVFNIGSCTKCRLFCQETSERVLFSKFLRKVVKRLNLKHNSEECL